jgi:hypothetical protein
MRRPERPAGGSGIRACLRNTLLRVRIPGGVPDFSRERMRSCFALLQLGCGKEAPAARRQTPVDHRWAARRGGEGSRRLMVRTAAFQAANAGSIPAGNANISLAVAQRPARVVRDDEDAGSNPAGETTHSSVAQWIKRARGYDPRGQGFDSLQGCQPRRRISEEGVPACRAGVRGFKSRRRRHSSGA